MKPRYPKLPRFLCWLLAAAICGCGSAPKTFKGAEINPRAAIRIGEELTIRQFDRPGETRIIVSQKSQQTLSGRLVDDPDTLREYRWDEISRIEIEDAEYSAPENALALWGAAILFFAATADVWEDFFDFDD